ncbi:hydroxyisourate hydrolase [Hahella ganghwensis]|uniref:hydroxyisourate hydrolase n=1 Tax=Hahella ganghwensis TaxID=286420 RepID=UPI00036F109B|nr:hydroxyisourate hydrolase [Hahella ganghwensis]
MASPITTHILDTQAGRPAAGVPVKLFRKEQGEWSSIAEGVTNDDGRITDWLEGQTRIAGTYRIWFDTDAYYAGKNERCFYPEVQIDFRIEHPDQHYHVPLLLAAHGFSTYRGS